jgi:hypothetical protein
MSPCSGVITLPTEAIAAAAVRVSVFADQWVPAARVGVLDQPRRPPCLQGQCCRRHVNPDPGAASEF